MWEFATNLAKQPYDPQGVLVRGNSHTGGTICEVGISKEILNSQSNRSVKLAYLNVNTGAMELNGITDDSIDAIEYNGRILTPVRFGIIYELPTQ